MSNRVEHTLKNFSSGIILKVIDILFPFIIKTLLIKYIGIEYLGLNSLFVSILQVLSLAELGMSSAIVFSMYEPIARNDKKEIGSLYCFYKNIYRIIGVVICLVGVLLIPFLHVLIDKEIPSGTNITILYIIYLFNTVISYFLFAYKECLLVAHQQSDISNLINAVVHIIRYILQIVGIIVFHNYYIYVLIIPLTTILLNVIRSLLVDRLYPEIICKGSLKRETKLSLYKRVGGLLIYKISDVLRDSFDSIIISAFMGLKSLALYQNYFFIMQGVNKIFSMLGSSMTASVGNSIAVEGIDKNYENLNRITYVYNWLACFCTVCLLCLYQPFMRLWLGDAFLLKFYMVILFCIYFYVMSMSNVIVVYRYACGIWWNDKLRPIIEAITNLLINILVVKRFGLCGVLLSTIFCLLFINIPWGTWILFNSYFKRSMSEYIISLLKYAISTFFICVMSYGINALIIGCNMSTFIIRIIASILTSNMFLWLIYRKNMMYEEIVWKCKKVVENIIKKKL